MSDLSKLDAYLDSHLDDSIAELSHWSPNRAFPPKSSAWKNVLKWSQICWQKAWFFCRDHAHRGAPVVFR
jgi:hypothetical protein